jgi:hypothetical protein
MPPEKGKITRRRRKAKSERASLGIEKSRRRRMFDTGVTEGRTQRIPREGQSKAEARRLGN